MIYRKYSQKYFVTTMLLQIKINSLAVFYVNIHRWWRWFVFQESCGWYSTNI